MNAYMNWHAIHASYRQKHNSLIIYYTTKKPRCQWELMHLGGNLVNFLKSWHLCWRIFRGAFCHRSRFPCCILSKPHHAANGDDRTKLQGHIKSRYYAQNSKAVVIYDFAVLISCQLSGRNVIPAEFANSSTVPLAGATILT